MRIQASAREKHHCVSSLAGKRNKRWGCTGQKMAENYRATVISFEGIQYVDEGVASRQNLNIPAKRGKDTTQWTWDICHYNY